MRRNGFGISVDVPAGWDSAIVRRPVPVETAPTPPPGARGLAPAEPAQEGERTLPVVHVCTRSLPPAVGDFGSGIIELLTPEDVFVSLVEYGSDLAGVGLFERQGWPRLAPSQFSPNRMFREVPGRSGSQHFFSVGGRAFCLFTVVGSHSRRMATVPRAAGVVRSMAVEPASVMARRGVVV